MSARRIIENLDVELLKDRAARLGLGYDTLMQAGFDDADVMDLCHMAAEVAAHRFRDLDDIRDYLGVGRFDDAMLRDTFLR